MSQNESFDNSMATGNVRNAAEDSLDRSQTRRERRESRRATRKEIMVGRAAVLAVTAALVLTQGERAVQFVGDVGSKIGDAAAKVGRVLPNADQASHDAAASHAPVPTTEAGLEAQANATMADNRQSQIAAQHHDEQPQP